MIINLSRIDFGGITGGKSKPEEVFDVQPTTAEQTITPTEGSVFSGGTVRAVTKEIDANIASNNIKEGVTILGVAGTLKEEKPEESFNVQPTTAEQTITPTAGSVFSGGTVHAVTSSIDSNIQPENIKQGVAILGVAGTLSAGDTPDYHYMNGTVDRAGLKAIGWTDEDILTYEQNSPHFTWQNDQFKVSEENKALYLLDDPNPSSYKDNPNITFVPKKNMESYFAKTDGFKNMKYIKGIPFYDTSNMTSVSNLFAFCSNLTTIPKINTSSVINASQMFAHCSSLTTVPSLDLSNARYVNRLFEGCSLLTTIPQLNLSSATNVEYLFSGCSSLTTIPPIDTSKVTSMEYAFEGCTSLTTIPQLNLSSATNVKYLFSSCFSLTTIPQLDLSSATAVSGLFASCTSLTTIPRLDLSSATVATGLFSNCKSLTTVPPLNFSNVTDVSSLFAFCYNLTTVEGIDFSGMTAEIKQLFGFSSNMPNIKRFIVNGKINVDMSDNYSIKALTEIDYDSVKSILAAADRTDNTNVKKLVFNRTMTDQNGELAALVTSCTSKGWTISGLTIR